MRKLLLVENAADNQAELREALRLAGYELLEAANGRDGIALCSQNHDIDLILADYTLSELDGPDMVRAIREDRGFLHTPVLFLTHDTNIEQRSLGRELGVKGWLNRPVPPASLVKVLDRIFAPQWPKKRAS